MPRQVSASGGSFDPNVDPGPVNPPAIFEPSTALTNGAAEVWVSASGGTNWGGALVSISFDGTNFSPIGHITAPAYQGTLMAALASHSDPDNVHTLKIDLTESAGILPTTATNADADAFRTLVWLCPAFTTAAPANGELIAYGNVAAHGTYISWLTYLRRGLYGTSPAAFAIGDFFNRIDLGSIDTPPNAVLTYDLPTQYIGATIYLKFQSFNVFGNALEDISTVTEYSYTPSGSGYGGGSGGVPTTPTGLTGHAFATYAQLQWTANPAGDHVQYYNILRRLHGLGSYSVIATAMSDSHADFSVLSSTNYDYEIQAVNAAGTSASSSSVTVNIP